MFSERQLEDFVFENLVDGEYQFMTGKGLPIPKMYHWYRQPKLGDYGVADIIGFKYSGAGKDRTLSACVIELKAVPFEYKHIGQLKRYMSAIFHYIHQNDKIYDSFQRLELRGILVVQKSNLDSDEKFSLNLMRDISVYDFEVSLDSGIKFHKISDDHQLRYLYGKQDFGKTSLVGIQKDVLLTYKQSRSASYINISNEDFLSSVNTENNEAQGN